MKTVLLPVDFSDTSKRLVDRAMLFLNHFGSGLRIFLLNTYPIPLGATRDLIRDHDQLRQMSLDGLGSEIERIKSMMEDPARFLFDPTTFMGSLEGAMLHFVEAKGVDLIILGLPLAWETYPFSDIKCPILLFPNPTELLAPTALH